MPKARSSAVSPSSATSSSPKASGSGAAMMIAPKIVPSTRSGSETSEP
jgi:hypothetical protein